MNEYFVEQYMNTWLKKQNETSCQEQKNLFTKRQYLELFKEVMTTLKNNKDKSLEELREILYENSNIEERIHHFVYQRGMVPGLVISYGTNHYQETLVVGNRQEVVMAKEKVDIMTVDSIFDLASITKLFTSLSILKLVEYNIIHLDDKVREIVPQFKNLKDTTIFDLLAFQVPLKTKGRVDKANSKEEGEQLLFDIEIDETNMNERPYTDMGAMILKYVIEKVTNLPYYEFLEREILKPNGLKNTIIKPTEEQLKRIVPTNQDGKYYKDGNYSISHDPKIGVVYDPKARIMGEEGMSLCGHAGLFSDQKDMTTLAKKLMNHKILDKKLLIELAKNRTGRILEEENKQKYIQYLGYLCYSKNPNLPDSEVYHPLSGQAFASAGWTGTQLTVDPINDIYFFLAGNRSHNRMTYIDPIQRDKIKTDENGKKIITLPNGLEMIDATRFAWDRDSEIVHPTITLAIKYKMLEDMILFYEKELTKSEKVKQIKK